MLRNYLKIALRNLTHNKVYSFINIGGLAVGMGVCLLICQYIYFETSYDKFHGSYQNIYRVTTDEMKDGVSHLDPYTGYAVGASAKEEIPGVENYVRIHKYLTGTVVTNPANERVFHVDDLDMLFVDEAFFSVFDFPLVTGGRETLFDNKFNMVITEKAARKYFGTDDPIGKTLKVNTPPSAGNYRVAGVLKDLPANSHLQFEFLLPVENFLTLGWGGAVKKNSDGWGGWPFVTYVSLNEAADPDLVREKLDGMLAKYKGERNAAEHIEEKVVLQPIADIHLKSGDYADAGYVKSRGSIADIEIFSIIAFFILFIAWVNYINLSTARSLRRAKEVGVRKSFGAFRQQLVGQFMVESLLVNAAAAVLAFGVAFLTLPILNQLIGQELEMSLLQLPAFWLWFAGATLLGLLLSGLYPAFVLSSFKPLSMFKAQKTTRAGSFNLRRGLIVFQFFTSLLLIAGTYLVYKQITFMKDQDLGMDSEQILVLKGPEVGMDEEKISSALRAFKTEVISQNSVSAVAGSVLIPGQVHNTETYGLRKVGEAESAAPYARAVVVGQDFTETYGLKFLAGSSFTEETPDYEAVVINEEAVGAYGLGSPEKAIGQSLVDEEGTYRIVGVVKNFHWHSLRDAHTPYLFMYEASAHSYLSFKVNQSNLPESLAQVEKTYQAFFPNNPFDYFFLEDAFNRQYQADVRFRNLFLAFSFLAILIACVGLFALVSYSATLRTKEVGVRKVLGASTRNLMLLLSKEYLILIAIAIILTIPAVSYLGSAWLENYAFKTNLGLDIFLIPALVLLAVSVLTVSYRTFSSARANPVESLRSE